jgi:hypothetical protein
MGAEVAMAHKLLLIGAVTALALAVNHFLFHWVLFTDAMLHGHLFNVF